MPDTNAPKQSPNSTQPTAEHHPLNNVSNYSKRYFLSEFVELGNNVFEGVTSCLEVIEKADSTSPTAPPNQPKNSAHSTPNHSKH